MPQAVLSRLFLFSSTEGAGLKPVSYCVQKAGDTGTLAHMSGS